MTLIYKPREQFAPASHEIRMFKFCVTCQENKPFNSAVGNGTKARGFYGLRCWDCYLADEAARKKTYTKEALAGAQRRHYLKVSSPEYLAKHNERAKQWAKDNPAKANAKTARRKTQKLQQMPIWADEAKIAQVYAKAQELGLSVDHIVPLRGKTVSGLHVHYNLQLLPHNENSAKGNKWA